MFLEIIISVCLLSGGFFILLSAVGIIRMPDLYMRISAATKATTLGVGLIVLSTALFFGTLPIVSKSLLVIVFIFLTAPVAGQILARAGFLSGSPLWPGTHINEYKKEKPDKEEK